MDVGAGSIADGHLRGGSGPFKREVSAWPEFLGTSNVLAISPTGD